MSTQATTYDVFLSYPITESRLAQQIACALQKVGLDVFRQDSVQSGEDVQDIVWRAVAESAALIAILPSESPLAPSMAFEVGAFKAWNKPIYVIRAARESIKVPSYLAGYPVYPVSRIDDVIDSIRRGVEPLSEEERDALIAVYSELRLPVDQLLHQPVLIEQLADEFAARCGKRTSGEHLVQELLRLRKRNGLHRPHCH